MHEGLTPLEFDNLKQQKIATTVDVRGVEWWKLTQQQLNERIAKFGIGGKGLAKSIWEQGPDFFTRITGLGEVDTSVLSTTISKETSPMGWFLYYFKEASLRADKTSSQTASLLRIAQKYLRKKLTGGVELKTPLEQVDQTELRTDLTALLEIGFTKFPGYGAGYDPSDCSDVALLQFNRHGQAYQEIDFRWRADSRPFSAVRDADGFKTKADSEGYAVANGMRAPYHPYSDPGVRKYLWFRRGQTDNCLYTVISVGKSSDWKSYLPFPKLDQALPAALFNGGSAPISTKYTQRFAMCQTDKGVESIKLPCTETWLYMFLLTGFVLETSRIQSKILNGDAYPEEGVRDIPLSDIYGAVKYYRFHHGPGDEDGFTALPQPGGAPVHENPFFAEAKYSDRGKRLLDAAFVDAAGSGPISVRWSATGYETVPAEFVFSGKKIKVLRLSEQR